jgi:hypothetical protein
METNSSLKNATFGTSNGLSFVLNAYEAGADLRFVKNFELGSILRNSVSAENYLYT